MYKFSQASLKRLQECDVRIQQVLTAAIKYIDFTVTEGHRSKERQEELYRKGLTKARYGQSLHNSFPSKAVDIAPYPIDWNNRERFHYLAGWVLGLAKGMGITLRWGGDWDRDGETTDNSFDDLLHFELVED